MSLFGSFAAGQDAAWEGLISAGRNALQQQNFSEAERHFELALEQAERFPSGDARLGKSYNNLAAVYYAQEDYQRAEPLMRRALAQLREALGPENTEVAQTMKNLAALYYLQGNRSEAEALLKQSLDILETVHGPNHAFVATVLSNLAGLYQAEDRYQDAEPLLERSLRIWESLLGPDHPDVVRSRALLAQVRRGQGPQPVRAAAAATAPKRLIPVAEDEGGDAARAAEAAAEIAQATAVLEDLAQTSKAEADRARAASDGVPVPALNPIGAGASRNVVVGSDAAASPNDDEVPASSPGGGITPSALEGSENQAASILNGAAAGDVSYAVYLSTLWSIDEARRYWQAMQNAVPDVLQGKTMQLEEVAAAGGEEPFYRVLTAPFSSDPEAQAVCERIKSQLRTHDCSVVVREATAEG